MGDPVLLRLPFAGEWLVQNSPARRVPSHGTDAFATAYAIDFVGVDERGRLATGRTPFVGTEPPERFHSWARPILAPIDGEVVAAHDGEPDHEARRAPFALLGYALTQPGRVRGGAPALAGNHLILRAGGAFVLLAHLRRGSLRVAPGARVRVGEPLAECGNSGNSTSPHVHVQAMSGPDGMRARALPLAFTVFRERLSGGGPGGMRTDAVPAEGAIVSPAEK